jgi:hypothetical protein
MFKLTVEEEDWYFDRLGQNTISNMVSVGKALRK